MDWWDPVAYNKVPKQIILTGLDTGIQALIQYSFVERIAWPPLALIRVGEIKFSTYTYTMRVNSSNKPR